MWQGMTSHLKLVPTPPPAEPITTPVRLYHAACKLRGNDPMPIIDARYRGCDDYFDLYDEDGHIYAISGGFVIFADWRKVVV
jgi:hypothetical protein